jgi:predicted transcriptional regulator
MTTLTIQVNSPKTKKAIEVLADALGAKIISSETTKLNGVEKGMKDIAEGRVYKANNAKDMVSKILK